jgi:hypothetical protein
MLSFLFATLLKRKTAPATAKKAGAAFSVRGFERPIPEAKA